MESLLLGNIDQPSDLKNLDKEQVNQLCAEIRQFLLRNISAQAVIWRPTSAQWS